jgi:Spy/CpxP family protein refolding chaperone
MNFARVCTALLLTTALPFSVQAEEQVAPRSPAMMGMPPQGMAPVPGMMPPPTPRPFAGVEFNAQQREQIQQMMEQERKAHQQRVERMQTVQAQLQQLYLAEQWDATAIVALYEKLHAEQRNTIAAMAEARNRVYALMSKEQREQMRHQQQEQLKRLAAPPPSQQ